MDLFKVQRLGFRGWGFGLGIVPRAKEMDRFRFRVQDLGFRLKARKWTAQRVLACARYRGTGTQNKRFKVEGLGFGRYRGIDTQKQLEDDYQI